MAYQKTTQITSAELIERLALTLSKRPERSELANQIFAELLKISSAAHVVLWRRESDKSTLFQAELASCRIEKKEMFDPARFHFWRNWLDGAHERFQCDSPQSESLLPESGTPAETKAGQTPGTLWCKHNSVWPIVSQKGSIYGILSLHDTDSPLTDNLNLNLPLLQIIANSLLPEKREAQDSVNQLVDELWLERHLRFILTRVNSRIDRDFVLQSAVDTLGNILKVDSCQIWRNCAGTAARVTHEFVDPELSPLGLSGNYTLPQIITAQMCERTTVIEDTGLQRQDTQYIAGMEALFENNIRSLAGTAVIVNAESFGALVIQSNKERKWQRQELKLLEATAAAVSLSLRNAELYQEAREQVFNLNLLANLSRQLTSAVEQLFKHPGKPDFAEETSSEVTPAQVPLSARELEVLRLIASGMSNREIAQHLFLTESTVELHASRIRKKLKLKSRTALVKFACDNHLV